MTVTNNILPLETFRDIVGYHPYHFYGLQNADVIRVTSSCEKVLTQHAYQATDAVGREDIRKAIVDAEGMLFSYLGYRVGSSYVEKLLQYPRPYDARFDYAKSIDAQGRWLPVNVGEGYIQAVGIEAFTDINTGANVTYSDAWGDGLNDTFTLTESLAGLDPTPTEAEIAVYFRSDDIPSNETNRQERWRVKPIEVSISGNTLTVTGRSWLLAQPLAYEGFTVPSIDPATTTNFVGKLDVVRRYTDPTGITTDDSQSVLIWETTPPPFGRGHVAQPVYHLRIQIPETPPPPPPLLPAPVFVMPGLEK